MKRIILSLFFVSFLFVFNLNIVNATEYISKKINSVLINGETSIQVYPGEEITITVNGNSGINGEKWESIGYQIGESELVCFNSRDFSNENETGNRNIKEYVPEEDGIYDLKVWIYSGDNCESLPIGPTILAEAISVISDTIPPTIIAPIDQEIEATGKITISPEKLIKATAIDNKDKEEDLVITYTPFELDLGENTITWQAIDTSGNKSSEVTSKVNVVDTTSPEITLIGNNPFDMFINGDYSILNPDADFTAFDIVDEDLTSQVESLGKDFDSNITGSHILTYNVSDFSGNKTSIERVVNVVENTKPIIYRNGPNIVNVEAGTIYQDLGAKAIDRDGEDITSLIRVYIDEVNTDIVGEYIVTYDVIGKDLGENTGTNIADQVKRIVRVEDTTKPIIKVEPEVVTIFVGEEYEDIGVSAEDSHMGDITSSIVTMGKVNTEKAGVYILNYSVNDWYSNIGEAQRKVIVKIDTSKDDIELAIEEDEDGSVYSVVPVDMNFKLEVEQNTIEVLITEGTTITGSSGWDGLIKSPKLIETKIKPESRGEVSDLSSFEIGLPE